MKGAGHEVIRVNLAEEAMHEETVLLQLNGSVATIVFNRPEKRNALTLEMWQRIPELLTKVVDGSSSRVVVLTGCDRSAFVAGADISEFEETRTRPEDAARYSAATGAVEKALNDCPIPTIAKIHGWCVGGGWEIAACCDFRFVSTAARFGITPAKLGIVYAPTAIKQLLDLVGPAVAKYLLFTGDLIDAEEANQFGLVTKLLPPDMLDSETEQFASLLATRSKTAISGMKEIMRLILEEGYESSQEQATNIAMAALTHGDYAEGIRAFLERRPPQFA